MKTFKRAIFWLLGGICIFLGALIAGHLESNIGVSTAGLAVAVLICIMLFLIGGFLWISVSVATKRPEEVLVCSK